MIAVLCFFTPSMIQQNKNHKLSINNKVVTNLVATHHTTTAHHPWTTTPIIHCTHTHSRPPLHQSHSCHHSLINPDCLTTPAPHSLTHIKAAHIHSPIAKSCSCPGWHFWAFTIPSDCYLCVWPRTALPWNSEPVPVTSTPAWYCLRLCSASDIPFMPADHCLFDSASV